MSERGSISSTLTIAVVIIIGVIVITVYPLMKTAEKVDNASQVSLQAELQDFVNEQCNKGRLSKDDLYKFLEKVTGPNNYDYEIEVKIPGENQGKKTSQVVSDKSGESTYTIYYTSQVMDYIDKDGEMLLPKDTQIRMYLENTNKTMGQELSSPTSDSPNIVAEAVATSTKDVK